MSDKSDEKTPKGGDFTPDEVREDFQPFYEKEALDEGPLSEDTESAPPFEEVREDFQPFYEKEARAEARYDLLSRIILYALLLGLAAALIVLVGDAVAGGARLGQTIELAAVAVICLALVVVLRKNISLESRVGLEAAAVGLILVWPEVSALYPEGAGAPWDLTANLVWPVFFLLALLSVLAAIWLMWRRSFWLAALFSLVVVYAAMGPIWSLAYQNGQLDEVLLSTAIYVKWPAYLRPGYLMAQVVLPLGILLMVVLQFRTLFSKHLQNHYGFLLWAVFLLFASAIGLIGLENKAQPVIPSVRQIAGLIAPVSGQPLTSPDAVKPAPAAPTAPTPAETAPVQAGNLTRRLEGLEREVKELKGLVGAQEVIIRDLQQKIGGQTAPEPTPESEGEPSSPESEAAPSDKPERPKGIYDRI